MPVKFRRKKNRLPNPEIYRSNHSFFVTICVQGKVCCLSEIQEGRLNPVPTGDMVEYSWVTMVDLVDGISIEEYAIMPNHFHGIITFLDEPTLRSTGKKIGLSEILRMFKARSKRLNDKAFNTTVEDRFIVQQSSIQPTNANQNRLYTSFQWQKSFYDHVIRNEQDYLRIQEYIINNPIRWEMDIFHPKNEEKYQKWLITNTDKRLL